MAVWGYAQGLIVGALSLVGFAGGAFLGSRLGPLLLEEGSQSPYAPLFALIGALLVGGVLASGLELLGFHLRHRLGERLGVLDGVAGSVLVACLGLGLVWIAGAVALHTPGAPELREPIQRSAILRELNERLPPSGPILQALARFDPFPEIDGPSPNLPPPDSRIARDPEGDRLDTEPIWFDARNDLALLRVPSLAGAPRLRFSPDPEAGTSAAILGFPEDGQYDVRPGRLGQTSTVVSQDAYGRGPVRRTITSLRGLVRQ